MNNLKSHNLPNINNNNEEYSYYINLYTDYYTDIINKMCHEISNPLTLINSIIQLMESKHPQIKDIEYWNQLTLDIEGCLELLDNFKKFRNCIDIEINNDNLLQTIDSVVNRFIPLAEKNDINLSLSIDEKSKPYYTNYPFDKIRLTQAITNIIKNAIEATESGDYVCVLCSSNETDLIIEIKDSGKPISNELKEEIFDPHVTNKKTGSGLGLPISRSIILSHLGEIYIHTNKNETNFTITLPHHKI